MQFKSFHYSALLLLILNPFQEIRGQDVEPRRWTTLPLGTSVVGAGYAYIRGDVFFDPVLEVEDATVEINSILASWVKPFKLGKKAARFDVRLPFGFVHYEGLLAGEPATLNRTGFLDPMLRLSVNLKGPPPGNALELGKYLKEHPVNTTVGVSMAITLPLGQYFEEKLINLGQNRFIFRPQFGLVHNWRSWSYELTGSVFLFTNNNNFFDGGKREQDPLFTLQTHLIKRFRSKLWGSVSLAVGRGGESVINDVPKKDSRTDLLAALSVGFPITKTQNAKLVYVRTEALTDFGADTDSVILAWSVLLFGKKNN